MANAGLTDQTSAAYGGALTGTVNSYGAQPVDMNPYRDQVIDASLNTLNTANQQALNNVSASATQAGAFGGSRHGVAEGLTNQAFADTAASMTAGLLSDGYDTSAQLGLQNRALDLQAANQLGNLSQQGFDMANTINNNQIASGTMQQGLLQSIMDAAQTQYSGFTSAPTTSFNNYLAATASMPNQSTQTTTETPGLMDYLSAGAMAFGGFA